MRRLNILLKLVLLGLLVHAAYFAELPQYKNKAVGLRLIFYPIAAALTYLICRGLLYRRFRKQPYPYLIDICLTFVVAFDLLGNTLNLYNTLEWWDDLMHLSLSVPWVLVFGFMVRRLKLPTYAIFALVVAYGLTTHIIWEALEYMTFVRANPVESLSAYRDTIGDLLLSLTGTFVGAWITANVLTRKSRR
jgi:hypothetical protein